MITKYYNSEDEEIDSRTIQLTDKEISEKKFKWQLIMIQKKLRSQK